MPDLDHMGNPRIARPDPRQRLEDAFVGISAGQTAGYLADALANHHGADIAAAILAVAASIAEGRR